MSTPATCGDCFPPNAFQNGNGVTCGVTDAGTIAPYCSGWSRGDAFGAACRAIVENDANSCAAFSAAYCTTYSGNYDCLCLAPVHTQYLGGSTASPLDYDALVEQVQQIPALSLPPQCLYPPCWTNVEATTVIKLPSLACGSATSLDPCVIRGIDVNVTDSVVQNLNVGTIQCGNAGASAAPPGAGNRFMPFGTAATLIVASIIAVVLALGAGAFMIGVWWRARALRAARSDVVDALAQAHALPVTSALGL